MQIKLIDEIEIDDDMEIFIQLLQRALKAEKNYIYIAFVDKERQKTSIWEGINMFEILGLLDFEKEDIRTIIKGEAKEKKYADKIN